MTPPKVTRMWTTIEFARYPSFLAMVIGHQEWLDCLVLLCPSDWLFSLTHFELFSPWILENGQWLCM